MRISFPLTTVLDKFTKLSKTGFPMKCSTANFLRFFAEKCQNLGFGWPAGYLPSNSTLKSFRNS